MTRELIIVGASARAAAYSVIRAGFQPYAIDQFADRDLAAVCPAVRIKRYPHDFPAALRDAPQAPWIYTGGLENYLQLVDRMAELRPLWGNPGEVLRPVRDPFILAEVVREVGLAMPVITRELPVGSGVPAPWNWLRKPFRSSGGLRISTIPSGSQSTSREFYYQAYLPGRAWGAVFLATDDGCRLLGVSQQREGICGEFAYQGSIVAAGPWRPCVPQLSALGSLLTARFGLRGLFNVDFVSDERGDWLLEVNPRYSASVEVLERATGLRFLSLHAAAFDSAAASALAPQAVPLPTRAFGKAIVYATSDGRVPPEFDQLVSQWNAARAWPAIADLPRIGDLIFKGQPICTVFAEAPTVDDVERALRVRVDRVQQFMSGVLYREA